MSEPAPTCLRGRDYTREDHIRANEDILLEIADDIFDGLRGASRHLRIVQCSVIRACVRRIRYARNMPDDAFNNGKEN